jgi:hypothetical protein
MIATIDGAPQRLLRRANPMIDSNDEDFPKIDTFDHYDSHQGEMK